MHRLSLVYVRNHVCTVQVSDDERRLLIEELKKNLDNNSRDENPITLNFDGATFRVPGEVIGYEKPFKNLRYTLIEFPEQKRWCVALSSRPGAPETRLVQLNLSNEPIYGLMDSGDSAEQGYKRDDWVNLTPETAPDYVRFFFDHVRGRHGFFRLSKVRRKLIGRSRPSAMAIRFRAWGPFASMPMAVI
jgi:hypothetical protein